MKPKAEQTGPAKGAAGTEARDDGADNEALQKAHDVIEYECNHGTLGAKYQKSEGFKATGFNWLDLGPVALAFIKWLISQRGGQSQAEGGK